MLIFDIETDGLLRQCREILCMAMASPTEPENILAFDNKSVLSGVSRLMQEETIVGHNIIAFDIPAIQKFYPTFNPRGVIDTLVVSRLLFPDINENKRLEKMNEKLPPQLRYSHSLEAWGYRLGILKGTYAKSKGLEAFTRCSYELMCYNEQDVRVTIALWNFLKKELGSPEAMELEHRVAWILARQERNGFVFNTAKAWELYAKLAKRKAEIAAELRSMIPPWKDVSDILVPKADNARWGYKKGVAVTKYKVTEFNPGSREHIARILKERYNWEAVEFTGTGREMIDESILKPLPWKEAKLCEEYLLVVKRLGQLADGTNGWLRLVDQTDGRIHGSVIGNGAVTGRMTHHSPNMSQVPANRAPYGEDCRSLFGPPPNKKQVGCDAKALELRCLGHFMAPFDGGAYANTCINGSKEEGTDIHTVNRKALDAVVEWAKNRFGVEVKWDREKAKTWFYAYIYGAGSVKLGLIITDIKDEQMNKAIGTYSRQLFETNLPALGQLQDAVKQTVEQRKYLIGLDKRTLHVRSPHSALNTLLQSAGALVMKKALVILDEDLQAMGLKPTIDYEFMANIHDEWQIEAMPAVAELVGETARKAIFKAGEHFKFKCPLDGAYSIGNNWKETH